MRQLGRGNDRTVSYGHLVVHLVAFFQPTQDGYGVFFARFIHQHFLKAPLQRCVFLDVLAVLVERGRADAVQLTARQRWLEHIASIHRAFALAGTNHGVQLIDKQDDPPFLLAQLIEHCLQALLELAAKLGTRDQRAHIQ